MVFVVKVTGADRVQKNLQDFASKVTKVAPNAVWNFTQHLAKELREAAPVGSTGRLSNPQKGIRAEKVDKNVYVIKAPFYLKHLESGTNPGYWVSKLKLKKWAAAKGIFFPALKYHIHEEGTKPHPFTAGIIDDQVKRLAPEVRRKISNLIKRTVGK